MKICATIDLYGNYDKNMERGNEAAKQSPSRAIIIRLLQPPSLLSNVEYAVAW